MTDDVITLAKLIRASAEAAMCRCVCEQAGICNADPCACADDIADDVLRAGYRLVPTKGPGFEAMAERMRDVAHEYIDFSGTLSHVGAHAALRAALKIGD